MDIVEAIVLGIVQGLTEWLPISSTAHLRIVPALVGWPDPGAAFTASIQLGTLLAVLIYFGKDILSVIKSWTAGLVQPSQRDSAEYKLGWAMLLGTIPIVIAGVLLKKYIESEWRSLYVIAGALIVMGIVLFLAERSSKALRKIKQIRVSDGLWVGLWQAIALVPGASRSGSTISGALFGGFDRYTAARFSFLLSIPSVFLAGVYSIYQHRKELTGELLLPLIIANSLSFIVGFASIAFLMSFLQRRSTTAFVVYRIALGLAIIGLLQGGMLQPESGAPEPTKGAAAVKVDGHVPTKT